MGGSVTLIYLLFAGSLVLLLTWKPGRCPEPTEPQFSQEFEVPAANESQGPTR
jgi:hypothetical protein